MRERLKNVLRGGAILILAGLIYAALYLMGIQIPCLFHLLTGLYCPGCGISRMFISILHLDFLNALRYNSMVMFLSPFLLVLLFQVLFSYVKTGSKKLSKRQTVAVWIMAGLLLLFGILRNIPQLDMLRPLL